VQRYRSCVATNGQSDRIMIAHRPPRYGASKYIVHIYPVTYVYYLLVTHVDQNLATKCRKK